MKNSWPGDDREVEIDVYDLLLGDLTPTLDLGYVWVLHQRLQIHVEFSDGRKEVYPCVTLTAKVEKFA